MSSSESEAVPEQLELKKEIFRTLDRLAPADPVLGSNSSSYPTSQIVDAVTRPQRVVNTHFYMPPLQNAVELMSCGMTKPEVIEALMEILPRFSLEPYHVQRESVGFIFNRIWAAIKRESLTVVADGVATPEDVDRIFQSVLRSAEAPFRLMDKVGLDVVLDIEEHYAAANGHSSEGPRALLRRYVQEGRLGQKTGRASTTIIPSASKMVRGPSKYRGLQPRRTIAPDQPRFRLPIVHEATHRHSRKAPIAVRHAIEMHLSEQGGEVVRIMRDDNPEMQILLGGPVHQMAYLKRIHRRAGLTAISFRYGKPRHQRNAIRARKGVT